MAQIDPPLLSFVQIAFFKQSKVNVSHLPLSISHTETFKALNQVDMGDRAMITLGT